MSFAIDAGAFSSPNRVVNRFSIDDGILCMCTNQQMKNVHRMLVENLRQMQADCRRAAVESQTHFVCSVCFYEKLYFQFSTFHCSIFPIARAHPYFSTCCAANVLLSVFRCSRYSDRDKMRSMKLQRKEKRGALRYSMCCTPFECACIALLRFIYSPLGSGMCCYATTLHSISNTSLSFSSSEITKWTSIFHDSIILLKRIECVKYVVSNWWKCRRIWCAHNFSYDSSEREIVEWK